MSSNGVAEITAYVDTLQISESVWNDIANARSDLYSGPLYFDSEGDECSCFDEGARQFDFSAACGRISDALGDISDIWVDTFAGDWSTSEPEGYEDDDGEWVEPSWSDYRHVERSEIIEHICGRELARYV